MKTAGHRDGRGRFASLETEPSYAFAPQKTPAGRPAMMESLPALAAWLEEGGLIGEWRLALGLEVRAAAAFAPLSVDLLTPGELTRYRTLHDSSRRRSWLTGRAALRRLFRRLDRAPETAELAFPNRTLSLAHCGGVAVAVACVGDAGPGLGVDLEAERPRHPRAEAVFLTEGERLRLERRAALPDPETRDASLSRLWTVKEALFKADPGNGPRVLTDYEVTDPGLRRGKARLRPGLEPRDFRYVSHRLAGWHLTLAAGAPKA